MTALARALAARLHDLPPSWDGVRIEWGEWSTAQTSMRFHTPPRDLACKQCGQVDQEPHIARGRRVDDTVVRLPGTGLLFAFRCPGCGHDEVHDQADDTCWDLDPSDYTETGSTPEGALW